VLARNGPLTRAALPCRHHAYTADIPENQVVLAGLALARGLCANLSLRGALHRAHQQWSTACRSVPLRGALLDEVDRARNRLTARYAPVHRLVRLLHERAGLDDEHARGADRLPGFLWNMATLFERFVARFLADHLPDHDVLTQETLRHLYQVVAPGPALQVPRPRPDLVVRQRADRRVLAVFDTKYRDLWALPLPREILYQMSVYAMAWTRGDLDVPAIVLYPVVGVAPDQEVRLRAADGVRRIVLRGVDWSAAVDLVRTPDRADRLRLAQRWIACAGHGQMPGASPILRHTRPTIASGTGTTR
jgi:5-methylcytosine-specific restriction enzyme subunit McrC